MAEVKRGSLLIDAVWHDGVFRYTLCLVDLKAQAVLKLMKDLDESEARSTLAVSGFTDEIIERWLRLASDALMAPNRPSTTVPETT